MTEPEFSVEAFMAACSALAEKHEAEARLLTSEAVTDVLRLIRTVSRDDALAAAAECFDDDPDALRFAQFLIGRVHPHRGQ